MADDAVEFSATEHEAGDGAVPGAVAAFPYDRMTVERFREAFPRARWRDDLRAWFVPGKRAQRRLAVWAAREWSAVLVHADGRGRDAFAFEPLESPYLEAGDDLAVRTPFSRTVIAELKEVPWARWDPDGKAWRVPFRSYEELRRRWPAIEAAARRAEPEARRAREASRKASGEHAAAQAAAAERQRRRYPVPEGDLPPFGRVLMTHAGPVVFEAVDGEIAEPEMVARFYPGMDPGSATLLWARWRRASHAELVETWPARAEPEPGERARGWWQPPLATLREERRRAASAERAQATRRAKAG